jgi:fumarylpyruvate hydrolase
MSDYVFSPPAIQAIPIFGSDKLFPVNRIFCVGRNYEAHAKEMGVEVDREAPFYFTKSASLDQHGRGQHQLRQTHAELPL